MMIDDWQPIETAPRDGTVFDGMNAGTGNVYDTWYEVMHPATADDAFFAKAFIGTTKVVWWCRDRRGKVTSFRPTHWRPKAAA